MNEIKVDIVKLPPMRIICFSGFGPSPEGLAFNKAGEWLKAKGLWEGRQEHRYFGFNNPDPSPGSPNYGYDVWVTVDETVQAEGDASLIDFPGGLYAVKQVEAGPNGEGIFEAWQALAAWVENSRYTPEFCNRQCLEESPSPFQGLQSGFTLKLYEPIRV